MAEPADLVVRISARPARPAVAPREVVGKREAIARAATELFLRQGYQATSTEQVASTAAVSKQTVYNQFGDKETLFREIVLGVTATAEAFAAGLGAAVEGVSTAGELDTALRALARRYLATVANPQVLALRRLVISEATRFPDLAAAYYERGPSRVLAALGVMIGGLAGRGLLRVGDPERAAADFAFLLLGRTLDEGMFRVAAPAPAGLDAAADHAVDVFLAGYRA
jgi:TetR/AcrR family transcriptional regulator, mexJK operon transcriptional repressor